MKHRTTALAIAALCLAGCPTPTPLPGGPPPEYEPGRPFPGGSASAAPSEAPKGPPFGDAGKLTKAVDAYMAGYGAKWGEAYKPSGVLEVLYENKVVYSHAFGKADRTKGTPPDASTQFRIGSLTKQFTAAAVLKLVEQGSVKLDDPVRKYVMELPDAYGAVTVDQLLHQTSGIASYTDDTSILKRKKEQVPESDVIGWIAKQPLKYAAGTKWSYSNSNYYLLSVIVERVSKVGLDQFMKQSIFEPAGMKTTASAPSAGSVALGYRRTPGDALVDADAVSSSLPLGAGFLYSSANDLAAWDAALDGSKILSEQSKSSMWTVVLNNYAMGWLVEVRQGTIVTWHNGGIDGYSSYFARAPERGVSVIFLSNVLEFDATKPGQDVLDMALGGAPVNPPAERDIVAMDETYAKSLAGEYKLTPESEKDLRDKGAPSNLVDSVLGFTFTFDQGGLSGKPSGQPSLVFRRTPEGGIFNASAGVEITADFGEPKEKVARGFTVKQGELTLVYVRGKAAGPKKEEPKNEPPKKDEPPKKGAPSAPPPPATPPKK